MAAFRIHISHLRILVDAAFQTAPVCFLAPAPRRPRDRWGRLACGPATSRRTGRCCLLDFFRPKVLRGESLGLTIGKKTVAPRSFARVSVCSRLPTSKPTLKMPWTWCDSSSPSPQPARDLADENWSISMIPSSLERIAARGLPSVALPLRSTRKPRLSQYQATILSRSATESAKNV